MRTLFSLFLFICFGISVSAQPFSAKQTAKDLSFLKENILISNPGVHTFPNAFKTRADSLIKTVQGELTVFEYFQKVSALCALSNEGHMGVGNWSDIAHAGFAENTFAYLPLEVILVDNRAYVNLDYSNEMNCNIGEEILAINGMPMATILEKMYACLPSDGHIKTYKERTIEGGFAWMYYLFVAQPETYVLSLKKAEKTREVKIAAITREKMAANYKGMAPASAPKTDTPQNPKNDVYTFEIKDNVAILTLKTFYRLTVEKAGIKPAKLYKDIFEQLAEQNILNLVIDVRDNHGGITEFASELLPYLLEENKKEVFKTTTSWEGKTKEYKLPKPSKNRFAGKIYVITNGRTFSTAAMIARYAKEYASATIVGEECGTRYEGFAAGSNNQIELPHSKISILIPRYVYVFPASAKQPTQNRGLLPDVKVTPTVKNRLNNRDVALKTVMKLVAEK